ITEHSLHGINTSGQKPKVLPMCPVQNVTYVSGRAKGALGYVEACLNLKESDGGRLCGLRARQWVRHRLFVDHSFA
ncbi:hypothetical protein NKH93_33985, partial [Mesorhizobium sp. M0954]|uniref:hypothetical protein n=1 Tax=Mesorhizobium sp. M0954 TaxID=2957032 RepID=UPI003339F71F